MSKFDLMARSGDYLRSLHPYGDWIAFGAAALLAAALIAVAFKEGKRRS